MLNERFLYNFSLCYPSFRHSELEALSVGVSSKELIHWWNFFKNRPISQKDIDRVSQHLDLLERHSIKQLYYNSPLYPSSLKSLDHPPLCLNYLGNESLFQRRLVSIVGSRVLRPYVYQWAELHLSKFLSGVKNTAVISGAAVGADSLAHELCIQNRVPSISFLPSGVLNIYPDRFRKYVDRILEDGGAIVSSFPCDAELRKQYFSIRNLWIAACGQWLFVLQAKRRSGSMVTARHARECGRGIASLPGDAIDECFWGTNDLLVDGAHLVRDRDDLVVLHEIYCGASQGV